MDQVVCVLGNEQAADQSSVEPKLWERFPLASTFLADELDDLFFLFTIRLAWARLDLPGLRGPTWSQETYLVLPGLRRPTWSQGAYLVSGDLPGLRGPTWSQGAYLVSGGLPLSRVLLVVEPRICLVTHCFCTGVSVHAGAL